MFTCSFVLKLNKAIIDGKTSRLCDLTGDWMKSLRTKIAENTAVNRVSTMVYVHAYKHTHNMFILCCRDLQKIPAHR